jgi:hypothetical protein
VNGFVDLCIYEGVEGKTKRRFKKNEETFKKSTAKYNP